MARSCPSRGPLREPTLAAAEHLAWPQAFRALTLGKVGLDVTTPRIEGAFVRIVAIKTARSQIGAGVAFWRPWRSRRQDESSLRLW